MISRQLMAGRCCEQRATRDLVQNPGADGASTHLLPSRRMRDVAETEIPERAEETDDRKGRNGEAEETEKTHRVKNQKLMTPGVRVVSRVAPTTQDPTQTFPFLRPSVSPCSDLPLPPPPPFAPMPVICGEISAWPFARTAPVTRSKTSAAPARPTA